MSTGPYTSDGKPIFSAAMFRGDVEVAHPGRGDDIANGKRWKGQEFKHSTSDAGVTPIAFQFMEWVYIGGGNINFVGADVGDWLFYELRAPSSAPAETSNPGSGAYAKLDIGGGIHIYCTPGTPGAGAADWDLDLAAKLNANVGFTKVVPVPSPGKGFFNWNSDDESVSYQADGEGDFNLIDAEIQLVSFAPYVQILGDNEESLTVPAAYKGKRLLPHWLHKVHIHNDSAKSLKVVWRLFLTRKTTSLSPGDSV
jgi:hypothetical protein